MKIIKTGIPLSYGLELECYSLLLPKPTSYVAGDVLGEFEYQFKGNSFKIIIACENSVMGVCLELITFPCTFSNRNFENGLQSLYQLEKDLRASLKEFLTRVNGIIEFQSLVTITPRLKVIELKAFKIDLEQHILYLADHDSICHCQVNLGFSRKGQGELKSSESMISDETLVTYESAVTLLIKHHFKGDLVCSGFCVNYREKGYQIKRDTDHLIAFVFQSINQSTSNFKSYFFSNTLLQEKIKWCCFLLIMNLHTFTLGCSYPNTEFHYSTYLHLPNKYGLYNTSKSINRYNYGGKDLLPILVRSLHALMTEDEFGKFDAYCDELGCKIMQQLSRSIACEPPSKKFSDIGHLIIIELRYPDIGHTMSDISGQANIAMNMRELGQLIPQPYDVDYLKLPARVPVRLEHYLQVRAYERAQANSLPTYLKGKYSPHKLPSSGLNMAARRIQRAWKKFKAL